MQNLKKILSVALAGVILTLSFSTVLAAPRDIIDTVTGEKFLYEEYSKSADKFKELLNKVGSEDAKLTYEYDGVVFNFEKLDSFVGTQVTEGKSFKKIMESAKTDDSLIEKDTPVEDFKVLEISDMNNIYNNRG